MKRPSESDRTIRVWSRRRFFPAFDRFGAIKPLFGKGPVDYGSAPYPFPIAEPAGVADDPP